MTIDGLGRVSSRRVVLLVSMVVVVGSGSGCWRKYTHAHDRQADEADLICPLELLTFTPAPGNNMRVEGCGDEVMCRATPAGNPFSWSQCESKIHCSSSDITFTEIPGGNLLTGCHQQAICLGEPGDWKCKLAEKGEKRALTRVAVDTGCPADRLTVTQRSTDWETVGTFRIDGCGKTVICETPFGTEPICRDALGAAPAVSGPPVSSAAPPPPPPTTGAETCEPACRSGYSCSAGKCVAACTPACGAGMTCVKKKCVSLCNPPCDKGERCTPEGECVR